MRTFGLKDYMNPRENINIIFMKRDRGCDTHTHEFAELIFITGGTGEHWIDGVSYKVEPGDLLFVNYGQTHTFLADNEGFRYYNLLYVPEFFSEELMNSENIYEIFEISLFREFRENSEMPEDSEMSEDSEMPEDSKMSEDSKVPENSRMPEDSGMSEDSGMPEDRSVPEDPEARDRPTQIVRFRGNDYLEIKKLVEDMQKEFEGKEIGYRSVLNGYSRVLFSKILRKLKGGNVSGEAQKCINRITADCLAYIDSRCFEKVTLKEIAEHTFYNPAYFSRIFKEHCGISLSEYIKEKRMKEAARLLRDSDLSNEEIMDKVGYTDKKQFYKNFRDIYGETPAQFRGTL